MMSLNEAACMIVVPSVTNDNNAQGPHNLLALVKLRGALQL